MSKLFLGDHLVIVGIVSGKVLFDLGPHVELDKLRVLYHVIVIQVVLLIIKTFIGTILISRIAETNKHEAVDMLRLDFVFAAPLLETLLGDLPGLGSDAELLEAILEILLRSQQHSQLITINLNRLDEQPNKQENHID